VAVAFKPEAEDKGPWWGRLLTMWSTWLTSQAFNNVLLTAILTALGVGAWWALNEAVPRHITMIRAGFEAEGSANRQAFREQGEANRDLIRELDQAHREERRDLIEIIDRVQEAVKTTGR